MQGRILLAYPYFSTNNILSYEQMMSLYPGRRAVMSPLALLVLGARLLRDGWDVRLVDENVRRLERADLQCADVVAISGMHAQRRRIVEILEEANALGKITALGGPSVSICPEYYPMADYLHVGEMGDATDHLLQALARVRTKPAAQVVYTTVERAPLDEQPLPALDLIDVNRYVCQPIQFSSGCPFTCEFCDIPMIYGRIPRIKSAARVVQELQAVYDRGFVGSILFVDDNLIANRKALRATLPDVVAWQKAHRFPFSLTGEASVNISRDREILRLLHDARFAHMFIGVESPDPATLVSISKKQNVMDPLVESIHTIEAYGIEVVLGLIFGFDSDTPDTGRAVTRFMDDVHAPTALFNLLAALPKTPLWDRMVAEDRLVADGGGDSAQSDRVLNLLGTNIRYRLPNELVKQMLRQTVREVYAPAQVYRRFLWNAGNVYGRQIQGVPPTVTRQQQAFVLRFTLGTLFNVLRDVGLRADYREHFWRFLLRLVELRLQGRIGSILEVLLRVTPNAHHLITWARILLREVENAERRAPPAPEPAEVLAAPRPERPPEVLRPVA